MGFLTRTDLAVFHLINGASGNHVLDAVITMMSSNFLLRALILAAPYVYYWAASANSLERRERLLAGLLGGLISIVAARACSHLFPFELRPAFEPGSGYRHLSVSWGLDLETWSAFPSDTAALCLALPFGLFGINRKVSAILSLISVVVFVLPRIYAGVHYPHDVLASAVIAAASVALTSSTGVRSIMRTLLMAKTSAPGCFYTVLYLILSEETQMFDGLRLLVRTIYGGRS